MNLKIELEGKADGRWIAEVLSLPGCLACGSKQAGALAKAEALALRVLADRLPKSNSQPLISA